VREKKRERKRVRERVKKSEREREKKKEKERERDREREREREGESPVFRPLQKAPLNDHSIISLLIEFDISYQETSYGTCQS
jgi:hypothetical protein